MEKSKYEVLLEQWCGPIKTDMFDVYVRVVNGTSIHKFQWLAVSRTGEDVPHIANSVTSRKGYHRLSREAEVEFAKAIREAYEGPDKDTFVVVSSGAVQVGTCCVKTGIELDDFGLYSVGSLYHWSNHKDIPELMVSERCLKYQSTVEDADDYYVIYKS